MIKGAIFAAALAAISTTASAEVVFVGTINITAVTAQCQGVHVGDKSPSVFHPKIAGNAGFSGLSWVNTYYANGYSLDARAFDTTFRSVKSGGVGWGNVYTELAANQAQIRFTSLVPALANINATTPSVTLKGQIKRLYNDGGGLACVATFIGSYVKDTNQ